MAPSRASSTVLPSQYQEPSLPRAAAYEEQGQLSHALELICLHPLHSPAPPPLPCCPGKVWGLLLNAGILSCSHALRISSPNNHCMGGKGLPRVATPVLSQASSLALPAPGPALLHCLGEVHSLVQPVFISTAPFL